VKFAGVFIPPDRRILIQQTGVNAMSITSRRNFLGTLALGGAALGTTAVSAMPGKVNIAAIKKETDVACVYHCDFGDAARFGALLTNINNHLSAYEFDPFKVKIVIVVHNVAIRFFLQDVSGTPWEKDGVQDELFKRFLALTKYGVECYLCDITFKRNNIDPGKARYSEFIKFVPSGVATVAELQGKGFSYLKVG
jgi:uncharacterized protein